MHAVPCRAQGRGREKGRAGKLASRLDCARVRTSVDVRICSSPLRGYAAAHSHSAECRGPSAAEGSAPVSRGRTYRKIGRGHQCSASRKGSTDLDMRPKTRLAVTLLARLKILTYAPSSSPTVSYAAS